MKISTYCFHMQTKMLADFQICISAPLIIYNVLLKPDSMKSILFLCAWHTPEKIQRGGGGGVEDILFWKIPWNFYFLTLLLVIPDKTKFNPWIFHKIMLDPLEISRPKTNTRGSSILFFLGHTWKSHDFN